MPPLMPGSIRLRPCAPAETAQPWRGLVARVQLVDDVDAALAANQAVLTMTGLECLERVLDLHCLDPRCCPAWPECSTKTRPRGAPSIGVACNRWHGPCQPQRPCRPMLFAMFSGFLPARRGKNRDMTHLPAGPRLGLAVEMKHRAGLCHPARQVVDIMAMRLVMTQSEWRAVSPIGRPITRPGHGCRTG